MRVALHEIRPWTLRCIGMGLGTLVLLAWARARGRPLAVRDAIDELRAHPTWSKLLGAPPAGGSTGRPGAEPTPASGARESGTALRTVQLTADEAKDPKMYARLKAQKQRGEIAGAVTPDGRPLV